MALRHFYNPYFVTPDFRRSCSAKQYSVASTHFTKQLLLRNPSSRLPTTPLHLPPQNRFEPRLIPFAITLEPMNNICIQPDRNRLFHGAIKLANLKAAGRK
jgi:hypothetical protein